MYYALTQISFPKMPLIGDLIFNIQREVAPQWGIHIKWYGVFIATGFLLALLYACHRCEDFGIRQNDLLDMVLIGLPVGIIGARIYYVFHMWDEIYSKDPISVFYIWEGGLAIYGAIIAVAILLLIFKKTRHINLPACADIVCLGFLIGQACGRWGNFANAEAFGTVTSLPWGMVINGRPPVHPTFFYESLWNVIGFIILHFYSKHRKYDGQIALMYLTWYGFGRMIIEGLRTDSLYIGNTGIRVSQLVAGICFLVGSILLLVLRHKHYTTPLPSVGPEVVECAETDAVPAPDAPEAPEAGRDAGSAPRDGGAPAAPEN